MDSWTSNKLPERLPFTKKRLPKKVVLSYILDYVIIVALIVTFTAIDKVEPFHQPWSMKNYTLHYPYADPERIPVFWLCIITVLFPAIVIAFYTLVIDGVFSHQLPTYGSGGRKLFGRYRLKDRLWELNCGILGLMLSVCASFTITGALKNAIGKPRPDLIARCMVREGYEEAAGKSFALTTYEVCTNPNNDVLKDGFRSFPSGHSSTAFAGLYYLSMYLAAKMHVLDSRGEVWKTFLVLVPTLAAALVAGSRIMDARHHPFDVLSGSLLGLLVAWASYRQYFPPVSETWRKGRAYPIRSWGREPVAPPTVPPSIRVEEDTEPLRAVNRQGDIERGEASGFSSSSAPVSGRGDGRGGNVFREQIHSSQRRREQDPAYRGPAPTEFGAQRSDTLPSASPNAPQYPTALASTNPFAGQTGQRGHPDDYSYSSSDDDATPGYELDETYAMSRPPGGSSYNPMSGAFTDTGYHRPDVNPSPLSSSSQVNVAGQHHAGVSPLVSGDLADTRREPVAPTVPPHAAGTTS
ncbi:lipid phosphate phosphatase 1 [Delitschia confertaspora ATCC 74209]|uniref:Lipid phosphate phosphatase 1 n=1 Tax=Delitschia confertaspora ATCC 74209 TaxID=1513339 RepID=A0A9P4N061_9PLEO|nr:lipid phosphate phosphatase 1 [Delitschia confertaspora ATCC 74209]